MSKKQLRIGFVSLGCPKNLVDSEVMMGLLARHGYELTPDREQADVIVVNTCGFIDAAKQESIDTILEMAQYKGAGSCKKLIVTGCLVERYRQELRAEIPEIDAMLGTNEIEQIVAASQGIPIPDRTPAGNGPVALNSRSSLKQLPVIPAQALAVDDFKSLYLYDDRTPRLLTTPRFSAYLKIAEGCDHICSFCIIPKLRGRFRSRPIDSILREAENLAAQGVRELTLVSQDTTHYGEDLGIKDGLAQLLKRLARIDGLRWIRFLYCYPSHVTDRLLDVVASEEKICKYLDIPFQHASASVLKAMLRGGSRKSLQQLVERARRAIPNVTLRTTFITGFPGETEEDFQEVMDLCREVEFDRLGVFTYSDEEGVTANNLPEKVDEKISNARRARLMRQQAKILKRKNGLLLGRRMAALLEGASEESDLLLQARLESQAPEIDGCVLINDIAEGRNPQPGDFVTIEITEAYEYDLVGKIV